MAEKRSPKHPPPASEIDAELQSVVEDLYYVANLLEMATRHQLAGEVAALAQSAAAVRKKLLAR